MIKNQGEKAYLDMCDYILNFGTYRKPENEEGRYETFAYPLQFDLRANTMPLLTTKRVFYRGAFEEMLWFITGSTKVNKLQEKNVKIWDTWAAEDGEVGPLYGYQWRHWHVDPAMQKLLDGQTEIDQLANVMKSLRYRPEGRSHMITAWRPDHLKAMSIKPCHILLQFYRSNDEVSLMLTQRSCDTFLGVPFNIAQYALLTHMVAHQLGCTAGDFTWVGGDVHIYENHVDQIKEQLRREIKEPPKISFKRKPESIDGYTYEDIEIHGYEHGGSLKGEVSPQGQPGTGVDITQL